MLINTVAVVVSYSLVLANNSAARTVTVAGVAFVVASGVITLGARFAFKRPLPHSDSSCIKRLLLPVPIDTSSLSNPNSVHVSVRRTDYELRLKRLVRHICLSRSGNKSPRDHKIGI